MLEQLIPSSDTYVPFRAAYEHYLDLGRPEAAEEALARWESATGAQAEPALRLTNAIYSGLPEAAGAAYAAYAEASLAGVSPADLDAQGRASLVALELWRLSKDDDTRTSETIATLRAAGQASSSAMAVAYETCALLLEARLQERRGDAGARSTVDRMDELFRQGPPGVTTTLYNALVLEQAGLYERLGDPGQAIATLERESDFQFNDPFGMRFWRERGRLAALLGDTEGAIRAYRHYLNFRYDPEPALEAEVEEVRRALAELTGA